MGMKVKYWDLSLHTVSEVEYGGRWHAYDNSLSTLYTLCDGKTIAGIEDIGKAGACELSGGKEEMGHIAKYHCLHATSPKNGFLTGSDTIRSVEDEVKVFNPAYLKYRSYFYDWDRGHRYILNLHDSEVYTRNYASLGDESGFYVPNDNGKDPEKKSNFKIRGNGLRTFKPTLTTESLAKLAHSLSGLKVVGPGRDRAGETDCPGRSLFKIEGANVITALAIDAAFARGSGSDVTNIAVSTTNGLTWQDAWKNDTAGEVPAKLKLINEVNGPTRCS